MEGIYFTDRIPIGQGVHIRFSTDGRALYGGCDELEVVPKVEDWLNRNEAHSNHTRVEMWLVEKNKQIEQDQVRQQAQAKRAAIDATVGKYFGSWPKVHKDSIRHSAYKAQGIPEEED